MQWRTRSTPVGVALLAAAAVLAGCGTTVRLDQPTPRMTAPVPPPLPVEPPPPAELPPAATPMPVAPSAEAALPPASAASDGLPALQSPSTTETQPGLPTLPPENGPLMTEARWLQQWFDGTPVVIAPQGDGTLLVEVPAEFCFDVGAAAVKPPLAAVLGRVRSSLERQPSLQMRIETPPETAGPASLARERSTRVREHFFSAAISPTRITEASGLPGSPVRLVINGDAGG